MTHYYEKLDENLKLVRCPLDDKDGTVTKQAIVYTDGSVGYKSILNVPKFFDENPEIRKSLGWVKHISYSDEEIKEKWPHTQSQYLVQSTKQVDEYTVEDEYHVLNKSEDMMLFEEMLNTVSGFSDGIIFM